EAMLTKATEVCREAETRFATIDWEGEFSEMDDDEEYSPVPFLTDTDFYDRLECPETICDDYERDAKTFMKKMRLHSCGREPDKRIVDLVGSIEGLKHKIINLYNKKLREEYLKGDLDMRPSIYCSRCNVFCMNVAKFYDHECKETTKCNRCGKVEKTYQRLQNHIQAIHLKVYKYNCKECNFPTDSPKEFERHNNSKSHKEKCGIERKTFECKLCDKEYYFESKYKEHLASVKHKKLSNT
ncbi:MAG: hypothetical protein NTW61_03015, partial [Candidatus Melainabacteria bacterium]|nr:hypothetical protein [Candidatus Melainabacteria bacterium]